MIKDQEKLIDVSTQIFSALIVSRNLGFADIRMQSVIMAEESIKAAKKIIKAAEDACK